MPTPSRLCTAALLAATLGACRTAPRAPAPAGPVVEGIARPDSAAVAARVPGSAGDVRFLQGMTHHHAQALEMTALVPARASSQGVRLIAERIEVSQRDEIATMRRLLEARGATVPAMPAGGHDAHAGHGGAAAHPAMPGMLTQLELARLGAVTGAAFDRLFLELMIRHHEGALTMVRDFFASSGAGQEAEMFSVVSDVDADQRAEIARMRRLLATLGAGR